MSNDFRIIASAFWNLKLRKLSKRHGDAGLLSLITLWAYAAEHKRRGVLGHVPHEDIELMADWHGVAGAFAQTLVDTLLIDYDAEAGYSIHDWADHNPYVATDNGKERGRVVDFRVETDFRHHGKIKELEVQLGPEGVVSLIRLWAFAAEHRTNGVLADMSEESIGAAALWPRDDDTLFVRTLARLALLDATSWTTSPSDEYSWEEEPDDELLPVGPFAIHNWERRNPYRFGAAERSAKAKKAARARYGTPTLPPPPPPAKLDAAPSTSPTTTEHSSAQSSVGEPQASPAGGIRLGSSFAPVGREHI